MVFNYLEALTILHQAKVPEDEIKKCSHMEAIYWAEEIEAQWAAEARAKKEEKQKAE